MKTLQEWQHEISLKEARVDNWEQHGEIRNEEALIEYWYLDDEVTI